MVCDLFQKKDEVLEQITSEDENENEEPGEEYYLTRGVQEQQHILPTKPTSEEGKEGLMVLGEEDSKPEEHERVIAEKKEKTRGIEYKDGIPILGNAADLGATTINTPDNKNTKKRSEISVSVSAAPPMDRDRKLPLCIATKNGHCSQHGTKMTKNVITSKKWCDRGKGRGYGYKTMKTTKYICKSRLSSPMNTADVKPNEEGSVSIDHQHIYIERGADKGEVVYEKNEVLEHSICGSDLENIRKPT